ncbi:hypothetical protein SDC9_60709 [bioreactor metagenome]|uniref:Uncharacterized protein n=1 Tax=bioreactor metagenome TaxID=1076179 RepID=A0A644XEL0_9ZZZZ
MVPGDTGADDDSQHGSIHINHYARKHVGFREYDAEGGGAAAFVLKKGTSPAYAFGDGLRPPRVVGNPRFIPTEESKGDMAVLIVPAVGDKRSVLGLNPAQTGFQC